MADSAVAELALQIEKALRTRQLYDRGAGAYRAATEEVLERYAAATANGDVTLRVTATQIFLGKQSVLQRDERQESFFFPLYRDGLRELTLSPGAEAAEIDALLTVLEAESRGKADPNHDMVSCLWRANLKSMSFAAIDGLGSEEGEGTAAGSLGEDYRALLGDLLGKIENPALAETGQGYSFRVDADTRLDRTDLLYEATTTRRAFEDNPTVLSLAEGEAEALLAEAEGGDDAELLDRFTELLVALLVDPAAAVEPASVLPVFGQLLAGAWQAGDHDQVASLLGRVAGVARLAPVPATRVAAAGLLDGFLAGDRQAEATRRTVSGSLALVRALDMAGHLGDAAWFWLTDVAAALPRGEAREAVLGWLRQRGLANRALIGRTLAPGSPARARVALSLIAEGEEARWERELVALAGDADPQVRLRALGAIARIASPRAFEALWSALESDPDRGVRLFAFQCAARSPSKDLPRRLLALLRRPDFHDRPLWEREKYARLYGQVAGAAAEGMFAGWMPRRSWLLGPAALERASLALAGLIASGERGRDRVQAVAAGRGKLARLADRALSAKEA